MTEQRAGVVGVIGATSPVGQQVLKQLCAQGVNVVALSRKDNGSSHAQVRWVNVTAASSSADLVHEVGQVSHWIVVAHIWVIKDYEEMLARCGVQRLVCISSTSRFTKTDSSSEYEEALVQRLEQGEDHLQKWCEANQVAWTVLRPTLIYGRSTDRNLSEIVKLIRKWRFFPLFGSGHGLRQPVYVDDVAQACIRALYSSSAHNRAYNISGAEVLSYREMVTRIFRTMGMPVRFFRIPLPLFSVALFFATYTAL